MGRRHTRFRGSTRSFVRQHFLLHSELFEFGRYVTPAQRHRGEAPELLRHRIAVYEAARKRKPQRWTRTTRNWSLSDVVWLNPEREVDRGQKRKAV